MLYHGNSACNIYSLNIIMLNNSHFSQIGV
ncbi:hypothetical protein F383_10952 [Gossypium arboreum]|uniref:Uncharacterized protein n=1 Tax=Gossypium arboreum TaxID=29729 RepID=A0A0B0MH03_GOSAR|nr:hypothetical protein F383_10952 [Gossypium arboreum]